MSQNIVAICDCDLRPARREAGAVDAPGAGRAAGRPGQPPGDQPPQPVSRAAGRRRRSWPPTRSGRRPTTPTNAAELRRRTDSAAPEVPRLPRDAREAEGPRRDHRRHAGSHARRDRLERDGCRQARLRPEAAVLVGARSAAPAEEGGREEDDRHADGQPAPLERPAAPGGRVHHGGRDRRRAGSPRVDEPPVRVLAAGSSAAGGAHHRSGARRLGQPRPHAAHRGGDGRVRIRSRRGCRGICSSAWRPR